MPTSFAGFHLTNFWQHSDCAAGYVSEPATEATINRVEQELGYKLPAAYIELMQTQNGGIPKNTVYPIAEGTSWAADAAAIHAILGIGRDKDYSLCGAMDSRFIIEEWGYPEIGVYFGDCPSAGHDMICFDYRKNGANGEPQIVCVDQECDYKTTFLAENFAEFVKSLADEDDFDQ